MITFNLYLIESKDKELGIAMAQSNLKVVNVFFELKGHIEVTDVSFERLFKILKTKENVSIVNILLKDFDV